MKRLLQKWWFLFILIFILSFIVGSILQIIEKLLSINNPSLTLTNFLSVIISCFLVGNLYYYKYKDSIERNLRIKVIIALFILQIISAIVFFIFYKGKFVMDGTFLTFSVLFLLFESVIMYFVLAMPGNLMRVNKKKKKVQQKTKKKRRR